jgi:TPR repeat protein
LPIRGGGRPLILFLKPVLWSCSRLVQLGELYRQGHGVPKDIAKARQWYEKAAAGGDASASKALAGMGRR